MKLYNPFRWHITKAGDLYFVRKWEFIMWCYLDADDMEFTWSSAYRDKHCAFYSLDEARKALGKRHEEFVE